jgi:prepilin-type N-terminal cleavage/methylation domain-containing protein
MENDNFTKANDGFTFIEIVVALVVAGIVVVLVFAFMRNTTTGIRMQEKRIDRVSTMILTRKKMDALVNKIQSVVSVSKDQCEFTMGSSDSSHTINFRGDSLFTETGLIGKGIRNVKFELDENNPVKNVFYWNIELSNGGYVSGGKCFEK